MRTSPPASFLSGGGEMGDRIRTFSWEDTPVGPMAQWSNSLRVCLDLVLNSRHPMFLWWGPELVQFYNDGYRPSLGDDRHPSALGATGQAFWADIWPLIGPQIESVMTTGASTWHADQLVPIVRNGRLQDVYWTYGYSAVRDDNGSIGGTLVVVQEQTARVLGERRLRTLRDLATVASFAQTQAGAWGAARTAFLDNRHDVPWALLYALSDEGKDLRLVESVGRAGGYGDLATIRRVVDTGRPVVIPSASSDSGGVWIAPIGRPIASHPYGAMVVGLSNRVPFNIDYRDFLTLAADQMAAGLTNARMHDEQRRRADVLADSDRVKTQFFSNVSHEFRTPLTLMLGATEEALASPRPAINESGVRMVHRNARRLLKLVNLLLDFSRVESGRAEASFEPTDLATATADIASAFRSTIERAGLRFEVECASLAEPIFIDREMWEKIVLNLLSNAFKFTLAGGIQVSLTPDGPRVTLTVRDTGSGIPEGELPRVFERFYRVAHTPGRTHEGSGIGLALVRELVNIHRGTIEIASTFGQGTCVTVTLQTGTAHLEGRRVSTRSVGAGVVHATPYVEEAQHWLPEAGDASPQDLTPAPAADAFHVLIVDDNPDMLQYLRRLLEARWSVAAVTDGAAALAAVARRRPDLVITDVMMPSLDGFELLSALRAAPDTRGIPVMLLTARAGEEARIDGWHAGADDYLVKPFAARDLLARVEAQLVKSAVRKVEETHLHELEKRVAERTAALTESHARLTRALADREVLERQRDEWLRRLINAQEEERRRVARELHDEMGQHLTGLMLGLRALQSSRAEQADVMVPRLQAVVTNLDTGMRRLARDLRPAALDDLGLVSALGAYVEDWSRQTGIAGDFSSLQCDRRLPAPVENTVYRIVQEALSNVARHSRARRASVVLQCIADHVTVIIDDDGQGIDPTDATDGPVRLGLVGIRERAALLGGTSVVESKPGATSVFVTLPLAFNRQPPSEHAGQ